MRVVGFIGPSGTGKSHRALSVAQSKGIEYIIDDGLLIKGNKIVSGISAKKESTKVGSIKRALFVYDDHREEMKKALEIHKPEAILILGTSDRMVESIAEQLGLPPVSEKVYINEVANEEEIKRALSIRNKEGKHVIPVPTFEIKKDFSGYFLDPLQIFRRKGKGKLQLIAEKSIVRPTFSYMGKYTISDYAIYQIADHVASNIPGISRISRFKMENGQDGVTIDMDVIFKYGYPINTLLNDLRKKVRNEIEKLTGLNIKRMNIYVKSLVVPDKFLK